MDKQYIKNLLKEALAALDEEDTAVRKKVVSIATKYIGGKYKYGKKDMSQINTIGVDCSGFTQGVFKEAGVEGIPQSWVNSTGQRQWGKEVVGLSNARPGDLICYNNHVAIYAGNNEIIDAGSSVKGVSKRSVFIMKILTIRNVIGD